MDPSRFGGKSLGYSTYRIVLFSNKDTFTPFLFKIYAYNAFYDVTSEGLPNAFSLHSTFRSVTPTFLPVELMYPHLCLGYLHVTPFSWSTLHPNISLYSSFIIFILHVSSQKSSLQSELSLAILKNFPLLQPFWIFLYTVLFRAFTPQNNLIFLYIYFSLPTINSNVIFLDTVVLYIFSTAPSQCWE